MKRLPPRLRAPAIVAAVAVVALAIAGAKHGVNALYAIPIPLAVGLFYYAMSGRDTDYGAMLRLELDERQALQNARMFALVGRVLLLATLIAYAVALGVGAALWPWALMLALGLASLLAGRLIFWERASGPEDEGR
jgi:hypothetical protein